MYCNKTIIVFGKSSERVKSLGSPEAAFRVVRAPLRPLVWRGTA